MDKMQQKTSVQGREREQLLALLEDEQNRSGCISEAFIAEVGQSLGLLISEVYGVATFYSFLSIEPLGRHVIRVCKSVPCYLKDTGMIIESVKDEIGISPGETTSDKRFSFELTNCIGACDKAPAMLVDHDVHGYLTPDKIAEILKTYE